LVYDGAGLRLYYMAYLSPGSHEILYSQTSVNGTIWTAQPNQLDVGTTYIYSVSVVKKGATDWWLFYNTGTNTFVARQSGDGAAWGSPLTMSNTVISGYKFSKSSVQWNASANRFEMLAYDLTSANTNNTVGYIHVYTSSNGTTWTAPYTTSLVDLYAGRPGFIYNGDGTIDMWYGMSPQYGSWAIQYSPAIPLPFTSCTTRTRDFNMTFESGMEEFTSGVNNTSGISQSAGQKHGGSNSLKYTSGTGYFYADAYLPPSLVGKTLTVWMYDDGGINKSYNLRLRWVSSTDASAKYVGAQINDTYVYQYNDQTPTTYSTVASRKTGWHKFSFSLTDATHVSIAIDDMTFVSNLLISGQPQFLTLSGPNASGQAFYVDDINVLSTNPTSGNVCATTGTTFNWSQTSTWKNCGGHTPGLGDAAVLNHSIHADSAASPILFGRSAQDDLNNTPALPAMTVQNTSGTVTGALTIDANVAFSVAGSVKWTAAAGYVPTLDMQPGSSWTFDQSHATDPTTAFYRNYAGAANVPTLLRATGTSGSHVVIRGKPESCANCAPAIWYTEGTATGQGKGQYDSIGLNTQWTDFYDIGKSGTYKGIIYQCSSGTTAAARPFRMANTTFTRVSGMGYGASGGGGGFPCEHIDYAVTSVKSINSQRTADTEGWWGFWGVYGVGSPLTGNDRSISYSYFDTGWQQDGAFGKGSYFTGFKTVSYVVFDGNVQGNSMNGPQGTPGGVAVDHMLVHELGHTSSAPTAWPSLTTSYTAHMIDSSGNIHSTWTNGTTDHMVWEYGEQAPSDTNGLAGTGAYSYLLLLPNAQDPRYSSGNMDLDFQTCTGCTLRFDHSVITGGSHYYTTAPPCGSGPGNCNAWAGSLYLGEGTPGINSSVPELKNSILWNPNPNATGSPIMLNGSQDVDGPCSYCATASPYVNWFVPTGIHNNTVWNYRKSQRWKTATYSFCSPSGAACSNDGTYYDLPMTGTVPGLNDVHADPQFKWQALGMTAPGIRDWAHIKYGADITEADSSKAHFGTAFAVFAAADVNDTTTAGGLKGRIDDYFTWIYDMWSSTNPALRGAASDGTDIGAAPVTSSGPSCFPSYPAAIMPHCNSIASWPLLRRGEGSN
jgi:hypothetical protein